MLVPLCCEGAQVTPRSVSNLSILSLVGSLLLVLPSGCDSKPKRAPWKHMKAIGTIHTPYLDEAPYQPIVAAKGLFYLQLHAAYAEGLKGVANFRYIYVLYAFHKDLPLTRNIVRPPWAPAGTLVGVFATRSPVRPNPIGISIVKVLRVEGSRVFVSGLDAFDGTPLLDIKPYIADLDVKTDANHGWIDTLPASAGDHLKKHILGQPHEHTVPAHK